MREVHHWVDPDLPNSVRAVRMRFSNRCVYVGVDASDDTVVLTNDESMLGLDEAGSWQETVWWQSFLPSAIRWAWALINNQGYRDGLQIEFSNDDSTIQLVAIASALSLRRVIVDRATITT